MVQRRRQRVRDAAPVVDPRRRDGRRASGGRSSTRSAARLGPARGADRRPGRRRWTRSATTSLEPTPMLRLLQGDVGSGKTAVAAYALAATARAGLQGALLAPTDLLARQHLETSAGLLEGVGIGVTLLTGLAARRTSKAKALEAIASGQATVVVGTHALIQEAVAFARPRPGRDRRAAPLRGRPARPARGQGRRPLAARPADDRDADPANARPGPLRGPRRVRPPDATGRPRPDPDRDGSARPSSTGRGQKVRERGRARPSDVRRRARSSRKAPTRADGAVAAESEAVRLAALLDPLRVGHGPRPDEGGRARRGDEPVPRRRAGRPRRHDRRSRSAWTSRRPR